MGSKSPTTTSTTTVPPQVLAQYQNVVNRANNVASQPYQAYDGQLVAPTNGLQNQAYANASGLGGISQPYFANGYSQAGTGFGVTSSAVPYFGAAASGLQSATPYYGAGATGLGAAQPLYQAGANAISGANGYFGQAADFASRAAGPLNTQQYMSPYTQSVIDATMANINRNNSIQQNDLMSSAIKSGGAFGGDRAGVAAAELARNQDLASNQTIAGLYQSGYAQALQAAQDEKSRAANSASLFSGLGNSQIQSGLGLGQLGSGLTQNALGYGSLGSGVTQNALGLATAGTGLGNLGATMSGQGALTSNMGTSAQNNAQNALATQAGMGSLFQQNSQDQLNALYQQWANQIAFPYQQASWLSNISTGIGSGSGGTTTATGSAPSPVSQIAGGATALAALLSLKRGGAVRGLASGGAVKMGFPQAGYPVPLTGIPGDNGGGLIPTIQINQARLNAPKAIDPNAGQSDPMKSGSQLAGAISGLGGLFNTPSFGAASSAMGDPTGIGGLYRRGGQVRGFAGGGALDFDDRFAPALDAEASGLFQPYSVDSSSPIVPDPGLQQVSPEAVQAWRNEADTPNPAVAADQGLAQSQPAPLPPQITGDPQPLPDNALAFDSGAGLAPRSVPTQILPPVAQQPQGLSQSVDAGSRPAGGLLGGMGMTEDQRMALLQLGLGLLASRSPNFGTALGEAGIGSLASMSEAQKARLAQAEKDRVFSLDVQRLQQQADQARQRLALDQRRLALEGDPAAIRQLRAMGIDPRSPEARALVYPKSQEDAEGKLVPAGGVLIKGGKPVFSNRSTANLDTDTLHDMAAQYLAGDRTVLQNLGRGAQGAENVVALRTEISRQARELGLDPKGIVNNFNEQAGALAGQRAVGTRAANISLAANEANNMIDIALKASDAVPRTQWMPINRAIQAYQKGSSSPELASFVAATNSLVNAYVRAVSPTGVPTDAMRQHAYDMLNSAQGPDAYRAVIKTMRMEMKAALEAPSQVRKELRTGENHNDGTSQPKAVSSKAQFDALPSGTRFVAPDGSIRVKP